MMLSTLRMMSRLRRRGPNEEKNKEELAGKDQKKGNKKEAAVYQDWLFGEVRDKEGEPEAEDSEN